ncbi:MAG: uracil-DNA glycosylase [Alphaproteobacteria bacterium]|nr:uracil-DNA glycosylase [Alphaproteobacteria bacterium]
MDVKIEESWKQALGAEFEKPYFKELTDFVRGEYMSGKKIYPAPANIFNAFNLCPFDKVKVVIIGQDPYHEPGQAHGLCFSVQAGTANPPSLQNIYKEIENDLGRPPFVKTSGGFAQGDLSPWARQGVLLLNSTLTVQAHLAASHAGKGWEQFTDAAIRALRNRSDIVYILWGSYAQRKAEIVNPSENLVLKSVHPSPLSAARGFFGNHHFSKTNEYLESKGAQPIDW